MMHYPFHQPDQSEILDLLGAMPLGRLITAGPAGLEVGLFPFLARLDEIEIHLNSNDPQLAALRVQPRCAFQIDELLSAVPSHWVDPHAATYADAFYRSVAMHGDAALYADPALMTRHLDTLVVRHQGEGKHVPVAVDPARYASYLSRLTLVRIAVTRIDGKFKLGQQEPPAVRQRIADELRARGTETDLRSAAHLQHGIDTSA